MRGANFVALEVLAMNQTSQRGHQILSRLPVEPVAAIVLATSGVLTSWAGYQAEMWDGLQLVHYGRSSSHRVEASQAALDANLTRAVEVSLFRAWAEAKARNDNELAAFYEARFPRDLQKVFPAWIALRPLDRADAPPSPFALDTYRPQGLAAAAALEAQSDAEFQAAIRAKRTADSYVRSGVILAMAMFFAGIGQVFRRQGPRAGLAVTAGVALLVGAIQLLQLPIMTTSQLR